MRNADRSITGSGGALAGIKVIDLTRFMAGPYATIALSDHGADVIKVESLPDGDPTRQSGVDYVGTENALFLMWNRGKRDIAVDLRHPEGVGLVRRLIRTADVFVENYRPGVADDIGLGYDALRAINPRLVYCSVTAYGSDGPMAPFPGTDPVVQATSGIMSLTGPRDGGPVLAGVPIADYTGSLLAVQGVVLALFARERTGRGQRVEISMLTGMLWSLSTRLASYWTTGRDPGPEGAAHSTLIPYQVFKTADDHVMAGTFGADSWPKFCGAMGLPDLVDDPRFRTNRARKQHRELLLNVVEATFLTRTAQDWEERFRVAGALFARVNRISDVLGSAQVESSGLVELVSHPTLGSIPQLGPAISLSDTPAAIRRPPPLFGQHTSEVLSEAGLSDGEVADLSARGIVHIGEPPG